MEVIADGRLLAFAQRDSNWDVASIRILAFRSLFHHFNNPIAESLSCNGNKWFKELLKQSNTTYDHRCVGNF